MSQSQSSAAVMSNQPAQPDPSVSASSDHLSVRAGDTGPAEVHFLFEQQQKRIGNALGASVVTHIVALALVLLIGRLLPKQVYKAVLPDRLSDQIV